MVSYALSYEKAVVRMAAPVHQLNVLGKKLGHQVAVSIGQQILSNRTYLIVESDKELEAALERFAKQPASVSYTDCIVMAVADRLQTKLIFGFDTVFKKNGYRLPAVPKNQQDAA